MANKLLQKSVGAEITVNLKYFHPSMVVDDVFPHNYSVWKFYKDGVTSK